MATLLWTPVLLSLVSTPFRETVERGAAAFLAYAAASPTQAVLAVLAVAAAALALLGLDAGPANKQALDAAVRALLRTTHPDRQRSGTAATQEVLAARRHLEGVLNGV